MSPVLSTVAANTQAPPPTASLTFLNQNLTTLSVAPFGAFPDIVDFNGSQTSLPRASPPGNGVVGYQRLTIQHDLGFRHHPPALCDEDTTLPLLQEKYGVDGVSYFDAVCSGVRPIQATI